MPSTIDTLRSPAVPIDHCESSTRFHHPHNEHPLPKKKMESPRMERLTSSVQSWVEEHKLATIGGVWAAAVGASVAYSRRRTPPRAPSLRLIHARIHAQALTLAVLGGAALAHRCYHSCNDTKSKSSADLDYDFYSQLPSATDADGQEGERWSW